MPAVSLERAIQDGLKSWQLLNCAHWVREEAKKDRRRRSQLFESAAQLEMVAAQLRRMERATRRK